MRRRFARARFASVAISVHFRPKNSNSAAGNHRNDDLLPGGRVQDKPNIFLMIRDVADQVGNGSRCFPPSFFPPPSSLSPQREQGSLFPEQKPHSAAAIQPSIMYELVGAGLASRDRGG